MLGLSPVCNGYPKGSHTAWATKRLITAFDEVEEMQMNKCFGTIRSAEVIPNACTDPAREHYQNAYFMLLYNLPPHGFWQLFFNTNFDPWMQQMCKSAEIGIPLN